jgi:ABC-2 type transport system ATP-binding protein
MITATNLRKSYGAERAVDDVSFTCAPGTVTGFLGPNGAGKSTTLRMITGLTRPDAGHATVAGRPFVELPNPSRIVGTLLDASAVHPGRTGRAILRSATDIAGLPQGRVNELLALVGLSRAAADRRAGGYSLGMRQRLGLAQSLAGDPQVLILDEPANGLDPEGIAWMRGLLRGFADGGGTVLLSSHLLAEVQATVDQLVVISDGRVVAHGAMDDLLRTTGIVTRTIDLIAWQGVLDAAGLAWTPLDGSAVVVDTGDGTDAERVARLAVEHGVLLVELRAAESTGLEDLFFSLTGDHAADAAVAPTRKVA